MLLQQIKEILYTLPEFPRPQYNIGFGYSSNNLKETEKKLKTVWNYLNITLNQAPDCVADSKGLVCSTLIVHWSIP